MNWILLANIIISFWSTQVHAGRAYDTNLLRTLASKKEIGWKGICTKINAKKDIKDGQWTRSYKFDKFKANIPDLPAVCRGMINYATPSDYFFALSKNSNAVPQIQALLNVIPWNRFVDRTKQYVFLAAAEHDHMLNFHFFYSRTSVVQEFPGIGIHAYQLAAKKGAVNIVNYFHTNRINVPDNIVKQSALAAAAHGRVRMTSYYFDAVFRGNREEGWNLLLAAAEHGQNDLVGILIHRVNLHPNQIVVPFAKVGNPEYLRILDLRVLISQHGEEAASELARRNVSGLDLNNVFGEESMEVASERGHAAYLKMLLEKYKLKPCATDYKELYRASFKGNADTVEVLLRSGYCRADYSDSLALKVAAIRGNLRMVQLLLHYGADPEASNLIPIKGAITKKSKCPPNRLDCIQAYHAVLKTLCEVTTDCEKIPECVNEQACPTSELHHQRVRFNV